jgi:small subunit ribosomal protein S1
MVTGKVTNVTDFGAFVELEEGIEGLIHVSEMSREKIDKPSDVVKVGETVTAMVLHIDPQERRIGLSLKGLKEKVEKAEIEKYISDQGPASNTLGELIQEEIERRRGELLNHPEEK